MDAHVTSLPLSRKLKKAGVKQESEFYWYDRGDGDMELGRPGFYPRGKGKFSAFLANELLEMLPEELPNKKDSYLSITKQSEYWIVGYDNQYEGGPLEICLPSLPEVAGDMVLWCKENNYL